MSLYKSVWARIQLSTAQMEAWNKYQEAKKARIRHLKATPSSDFSPDLTCGGREYLDRLYIRDNELRQALVKAKDMCTLLDIPTWYL